VSVNPNEKRYNEVEAFDQFCANLRQRLIAKHEGDLQETQRLYRRAVVYAFTCAKAATVAKNPNDFTDVMTPEWQRFRFNMGEISRLMRKWRSVSFREIRGNYSAVNTSKRTVEPDKVFV
jgi:hypothetical protein